MKDLAVMLGRATRLASKASGASVSRGCDVEKLCVVEKKGNWQSLHGCVVVSNRSHTHQECVGNK